MKHQRLCIIFSLAGALTLAACGDDGPSVDPEVPDGSVNPPPAYSVGGSVAGLSGSLTLQNDGRDALTVTANGSFTFATELADGAGYEVTVSAQPEGQLCSVANGSGTIDGADVTDVAVTCAANRDGITTFSGTLRDQNGTPIAGATLRVGDVSATSSLDGTWTVPDAPRDATLVIDAGAEFLPFRVQVSDFPDGLADEELVLRRADLRMTIDPSQAIEVSIGDAVVQIPVLPGINEDLDIKGWYYDANSPSAMASIPVPLRGTDGTTDFGLISRGMIGMTLTGAESGNAYTDFSAAADPFRVFIPMPFNAIGLTPTIDLWRTTDDDEIWQHDGIATYDEVLNLYRFEVTRWSIYNLDYKGPRCQVRVNFLGHAAGNTYEGTVTGPYGFGSVGSRPYRTPDNFITFLNLAQGFTYPFVVIKRPAGEVASAQLSCGNTPIDIEFARDTTPPGPVTGVSVQANISTCSMTLSWTNPPDADYASLELCPIRSRISTMCTSVPVVRGRTETTHTFSGASSINCGNQTQTIFEFRTVDDKTPPNKQSTPILVPFTMQ